MSVFTLDLDDEEREAMEAHRVRLGLRSGAETIRALLLMKPQGGFAWYEGMTRQSEAVYVPHQGSVAQAPYAFSKTAEIVEENRVNLLTRKAFNPQPKVKGKKA